MFKSLQTDLAYSDVSAEVFNQLIASNPDAVLIDVRTPAEVRDRSIPKAINIDIQQSNFDQKIARLDKRKTYLVYCRSGQACSMMAANGFTSVYNLSGGLMNYRF